MLLLQGVCGRIILTVILETECAVRKDCDYHDSIGRCCEGDGTYHLTLYSVMSVMRDSKFSWH